MLCSKTGLFCLSERLHTVAIRDLKDNNEQIWTEWVGLLEKSVDGTDEGTGERIFNELSKANGKKLACPYSEKALNDSSKSWLQGDSSGRLLSSSSTS